MESEREIAREIITLERGLCARQFARGAFFIGAVDMAALERHAHRLRLLPSSLPRFSPADAVALIDAGSGICEVWVAPAFANYRGAYFAAHRTMFDSRGGRLFGDLHVDHIHARAAALEAKLRYVRVAAVSASVNTGLGWIEAYCAAPVDKALGLVAGNVIDLIKLLDVPFLASAQDSPSVACEGAACFMAASAFEQGHFKGTRLADKPSQLLTLAPVAMGRILGRRAG